MLEMRIVRCGLFGLSLSCLSVAMAQAAAPVTSAFTVGSANVAVADPTVPRPRGHACVVELFRDAGQPQLVAVLVIR